MTDGQKNRKKTDMGDGWRDGPKEERHGRWMERRIERRKTWLMDGETERKKKDMADGWRDRTKEERHGRWMERRIERRKTWAMDGETESLSNGWTPVHSRNGSDK